MAAVNLPAATTATATYNSDNTLLTWNGMSATHDAGQNLTLDPSNSNSYTWSMWRGHLSSVNSAYNLVRMRNLLSAAA